VEKREYPVSSDPALLIKELRAFFSREGMDVHSRPEGSASVLIAYRPTSWRDHLGLKRSLTVKIITSTSGTAVEIGKEQWLNKIIPGVVGLITTGAGIGFVLLGITAWGAHAQYRLKTEAWNIVERHITHQGGEFQPGLAD
jgi:hypothetical protein